MINALKKTHLIFLAVLLAIVIAFPLMRVHAQEEETNSGSGLRVSPTRSDISVKAGEAKEITQTVKNVTQGVVTVQPSLNDFESDGVTGQPQLIGDPNDISVHSLRQFINLPDKFELQPDEEKELKINVVVPSDAGPGAYYGSVLYRAAPVGASNDGQVALVASVGSLVLLEVPGEITEKIEIESISAYLGDKSGSFFTRKPDALGVKINNLGNSFARPFGKIAVTDWRGNKVFEYELNDSDRRKNILPDSGRLFTQELFNVEEKTVNGNVEQTKTSPLKWPGRYSITGNVSHGTTGELFTVSATFWYIPAWVILTVVVVLLAVIVAGFLLYRKYLKNHNRRR